VGELVPDHTGEFSGAQHVEQAGRGGNRCMVRVAPGRKCIGLRVLHQKGTRHWQPGAAAELAHEPDEFGCGAVVNLLSPVHRKHELVGPPIAEQVHCDSYNKGDHHALWAAEEIPDCHEERGQPRQQDGGARVIHRNPPAVSG